MTGIKRPYSMNVYEIPTVDNVCNQILREVLKLDSASMAHVIMDTGNVSLLHKHSRMSEIYYILEGKGILYHGDAALKVKKGAFLNIPPGCPHKLWNNGDVALEHLVFASPPFDPEDVILLDEPGEKKDIQPETFCLLVEPVIAQDGAAVYELLSQQERVELGMALAVGMLPPDRKATPHYHKISDEVYYVLSGSGNVVLGDSKEPVRKGSTIYIPVNTVHSLENDSTSEELEVLCISSPPYVDDDFLKS